MAAESKVKQTMPAHGKLDAVCDEEEALEREDR